MVINPNKVLLLVLGLIICLEFGFFYESYTRKQFLEQTIVELNELVHTLQSEVSTLLERNQITVQLNENRSTELQNSLRNNELLMQNISTLRNRTISLQQELETQRAQHASCTRKLISFNFENYNVSSNTITDNMWRDYVTFHRNAIQEECCKYLVFKPHASGFGNRIQMLAFSFQIALVTGRVFLVDWTEPCSIGHLFDDPPINWYFERLPNSLKLAFKESNLNFDFTSETAAKAFFQNKDIKRELDKYKFVVIEHYSTFEVPLSQNVRYRDFFSNVFHNNSIKVIFELILKPHKTIAKEIEDFKKKHELDKHPVIAMQIRRGTKQTSFVEIATLKEEEMFFTCALKLSNSTDTKFFLATDDHTTRARAVQRLGNRVVFNDKPIVHSGMQQTVDTTGKPRTLEGLRAVVFDFWMLGEFDKLLITDYSSFSRIAGQRTERVTMIISPLTKC